MTKRKTRKKYLAGNKEEPKMELEKTMYQHDSFVTSVSFSPDGNKMVSGGNDKWVCLWNIGTDSKRLLGHKDKVTSVSFSPDGERVVSGSVDKTVRLWDVETGRNTHKIDLYFKVNSVHFSPNGKTVVIGYDNLEVEIWDLETEKFIKTMKGHSSLVYSVRFSPDGKTVVSGSGDNTVRLWDVETGKNIKTLQGHSSRVHSVSFSPDGETVASGSDDETVRLWDVKTGDNIKTLKHRSDVRSVSFSPDGETIASYDGSIRFWDVKTGNMIHTKDSNSGLICYSPDGMRMTIGGREAYTGRFEIWKLNENLNTKGFIRNHLKKTKGWEDSRRYIGERDPRWMNSAELKDAEYYHPDNLRNLIADQSDDFRRQFNLEILTPEQTSTTKKTKGNVTPLAEFAEKGCNKLEALYRKYKHDVGKLKIVHKKVTDFFKDIKKLQKDKKFNTRRERPTSIRSMPTKSKNIKATRLNGINNSQSFGTKKRKRTPNINSASPKRSKSHTLKRERSIQSI